MDIIKLPEVEKSNDLIFSGSITEKSALSSSKMVMSGFVSTTTPDLVGDVILPNAFDKHIRKYQERPIYLYQHDKKVPIGRVSKVHTNYTKNGKTGLYLEDIVLSDIPVVRDVIWKLVQDEVLTQQSVGMYSIDGAFNAQKGVFEHSEVYLYESSLVSVAANPDALIDIVGKGIPDLPLTMEELVKAYDSGKITPAFSISTYVPDLGKSDMTNQPSNTSPDFAGLTVLKHNEDLYDTDESPATNMPKRIQTNYAEVCDAIHACKSITRNSYMFQVAVPTEKGFKYDWELTATSMARVLGANGGAHYNVEEKAAVVGRIAEAYTFLEKKLPEIDGVPVDKIEAVALHEAEFKSVSFAENEPGVYQLSLFEKDVTRVLDTVKSFKKSGELPEKAVECLKWLMASIEIDIEAYPDTQEDVDLIASITGLIQRYRAKKDQVAYEMSADDVATLKNLVGIEEVAEEVEETPNPVSEELVKQLQRAGLIK